MHTTKITVILTVLNEEKTILKLLDALFQQTYKIEKIIITDGGSIDSTENLVHQFRINNVNPEIEFIKVLGNRSVGRNVAILNATTQLIAVTDAGCIPHQNWLEELFKKYEKESVVAGYYDAVAKTGFEQAVVPYVLVMPDKVNPKTFLPATRSLLIEKETWQKVGKFNEALKWNEDYEFAQRLLRFKVSIRFAENAKVTWIPRSTLIEFWSMIWNFAKGDVEAKIWRKKVILIFTRYFFGSVLLVVFFLLGYWKSTFLLFTFFLTIYCIWAYYKNQKYLSKGKLWLPVLQITSDLAVMGGSLAGLMN